MSFYCCIFCGVKDIREEEFLDNFVDVGWKYLPRSVVDLKANVDRGYFKWNKIHGVKGLQGEWVGFISGFELKAQHKTYGSLYPFHKRCQEFSKVDHYNDKMLIFKLKEIYEKFSKSYVH